MRKFSITVNGQSYDVAVDEVDGGAPAAAAATAPSAAPVAAPAAPVAAPAAVPADGTKVTAPMPGNVNGISVAVGDAIKAGDKLIVLESMKMENDITAPVDGTVQVVAVKKGDVLSTGALIAVIG